MTDSKMMGPNADTTQRVLRKVTGRIPVNLRTNTVGVPSRTSLEQFIASAKLSPKKARMVRELYSAAK